MLKQFCLSILFLCAVQQTHAQECFEHYKNDCKPKPSKFIYKENTASVSFLFSSGELREIPFSLILGIDYRITLCADEKFNDVIQFIIKSESGKEIYNNSKQNYNLNLEFACRKTQDVIFELIAPDLAKEDSIEGCIGVLIEEMVSVKTGF